MSKSSNMANRNVRRSICSWHVAAVALAFPGGRSSGCPQRLAMSDFHHGHEPRAEEIALHQKYLTLEGQIDAARLEGDEAEARRLAPLVKRAKARWIKANRRVTRGS